MENYKVAIIYGKDDPTRNIKEGQIETFGNIDDGELHVTSLLRYAKEKYSDIAVFQQLSLRHTPETVAYFLTLFGHIVFLNQTSKSSGRKGTFMFPNEIKGEGKEALYDFTDSLTGYAVDVFYDLNIDGGIVDGEALYCENETPREMLQQYFEKKKTTTRTK